MREYQALLALFEYQESYHRRIKLVQVLPLRLVGGHHVDLSIFEWPAIPHLGHNILCIGTQGAILTSEQGHTETPLLAEDGGCSHLEQIDCNARVKDNIIIIIIFQESPLPNCHSHAFCRYTPPC